MVHLFFCDWSGIVSVLIVSAHVMCLKGNAVTLQSQHTVVQMHFSSYCFRFTCVTHRIHKMSSIQTFIQKVLWTVNISSGLTSSISMLAVSFTALHIHVRTFSRIRGQIMLDFPEPAALSQACQTQVSQSSVLWFDWKSRSPFNYSLTTISVTYNYI